MTFFISRVLALGHTVSEIDISKVLGVFDKTLFSMLIPEVEEILKREEETRKSVVLFGIEVSIKCYWLLWFRIVD